MLAFTLSGAVFLYWLVLGLALLSFVSPASIPLSARLPLAPVVGLAATVLPAFWISRLGVPVHDFAWPLTLTTAVIAGAALALRWRPDGLGRAIREQRAVFAALAAAMLLIGWPLLLHGFEWLSIANDDMANYVLAAHRFADNGFSTPPTLDALLRSTDTAQVYWFLHGNDGARPGSELALAWLISLTGLNGFHLFMPVMIALHLTMIAAVTALVAVEDAGPRVPAAAALLLTVNPLIAFGTVSQLIAQVGGLALLAGSLAALRVPWTHRGRDLVRAAGLAGLTLAAFLVWYPEAYPFLGLGAILYLAINARRWAMAGRQTLVRVAGLAVAAVLLVPALTGHYFVQSVIYLLGQAASGTQGGSTDVLFPYFLIPSGISTFWGFQPLALELPEPWQSLAILGGLLLLPAAAAGIAAVTRRGAAIACVTMAMALLAALLFARGSDFGLFKIAMFIQPFLVGTLVLAVSAWLGGPAGAPATAGEDRP